jgi:hypothetical protein
MQYSLNASKAADCKSCTVLGGGRALTSPRGGAGADACISGAWLAVANMAAAKVCVCVCEREREREREIGEIPESVEPGRLFRIWQRIRCANHYLNPT